VHHCLVAALREQCVREKKAWGIRFKNRCLCISASCCCWCLVALYELCMLTRLHEVASKVLFSFALGGPL